jgi:hypothetical protein
MTEAITYRYAINGSAAQGQTWATSGEVSVLGAGSFMVAVERAMRDSFMDLTQGRAIFGEPGKGCVGPYRVTKLEIIEWRPINA